MRIIPDNALILSDENGESVEFSIFPISNTIEITDNDWNEIYASYYLYVESNIQYDGTTIAHVHKTFATYLRELLELKALQYTTLGH